MEDFEQKTDSMEEEKTTSSEISCAEEATENCIEMTVKQDEETTTEASAEAEEIRNPEEERPDSMGKKILVPLLSFFVPVLLFGLAWANNGITYGGNVTPLIYDMDGQYLPFIASLRYLISGENSILFNWNVNMGGNYLSSFAYYLASPINLISIFYKIEDLSDAIYLITIIKIGLCGLNFSTYLKHGLSKDRVYWRDVLFASSYALMSYNFMYSMCIMWLDGVLMMPLVLLGVEKLFEGKKGAAYFFSILTTFYCNFYISYMVGVFVAVYFLAGVVRRFQKDRIKEIFFVGVRFAINTICALLICMPMIWPTLKSASMGYREISGGADERMYQFTFFDLIKKFLPQQYDSIEYSGLPSIFCGSLILIVAVCFFFQKRSIKTKIAGAILLLVPLSGFLIPKIDYVLHGFQYPHSYMYRYAFTFSFSLVVLSRIASRRIPIGRKNVGFIFAVLSMYSFIELFLNGSVIFSGLNLEAEYKTRANKNAEYELLTPLMNCIDEKTSGDLIERVGSQTHATGDCSLAMYNLKGTESFTSTFNYNLNTFLTLCGSNNMLQTTTAGGNSSLLNSVLGIRYILSSDDYEKVYELIDKFSYEDITVGVYENKNALPIAFAVPRTVECNIDIYQNPFEAQNAMMLYLGWEKPIFFPLESSVCQDKNEFLIKFELPQNAIPYLSITPDKEKMEGENQDFDTLIVGSKIMNKEYKVQLSGMRRSIDIENAQSGKNEISISGVADFDENDYSLYYMNEDDFYDAISFLNNKAAQNISCCRNRITMNIDVAEEEVIFTSIPYDDGWEIEVDGERVKNRKILNSFLCLFVEPGNHFIEMRYVPVGLYTGLAMGSIGCILVLLCYQMDKICLFRDARR